MTNERHYLFVNISIILMLGLVSVVGSYNMLNVISLVERVTRLECTFYDVCVEGARLAEEVEETE